MIPESPPPTQVHLFPTGKSRTLAIGSGSIRSALTVLAKQEKVMKRFMVPALVMGLLVQEESHPTPLGDGYYTEDIVMRPSGEVHSGLR